MADEVKVDPEVLDSIAGKLRTGASDMDGAGTGCPESVDAGDLSASITAAFAQLLSNAGNLVTGMRAAGDAVAEARDGYAGTDNASALGYRGED